MDINIEENVLLIKVARYFNDSMSEMEKYEITRGVWKVGKNREQVDFVFTIFNNKIIATYKVDSWHPAGSTLYQTRTVNHLTENGTLSLNQRFEFTGYISKEMEKKYLGKSVIQYFPRGAANPIRYINI